MKILRTYINFLGREISNQIEETVDMVLPRGKNLTFLDCGCGDGSKTMLRAREIGTKNVFGVEVIPDLILKAKNMKRVEVYNFDLNFKWKIKSNSVDIITATETVEHLINLDNFFLESARVLRKKGKIIISTENLASYHNILALLGGNQPYTGPYLSRIYPMGHKSDAFYFSSGFGRMMFPHLNVMTGKSLEILVKKFGFTLIRSFGIGFYPFPKIISRLFSKIDKFHSTYYLILAEK